MDAGDKPKKVHKKAAAGAKAKKKRDKEGPKERHNPKAFTFSGGSKAVQKNVIYSAEKKAQKEHGPRVDRAPETPPPFVVVVHGPPGVGKTTLIHSLVKHYARQKLINMRGPVTLVSSKQRRITIVECTSDMATMLDLAKVADLVLFMIDGSFGFELETFEFINVLQVHGFPKVAAVVTHLDGHVDNKQLKKTKKTLKSRFWADVFDGAKMFYLSGLLYGRYHHAEVATLARYITVQRPQVLSWRQTHPYVLGLRWEDHTDPGLPAEHPRRLDVYGYVYGGRLREGSQVHMAGVGDFHISALRQLADPCPPPAEVEAEKKKAQLESGQTDGKKKNKDNPLRTLAERHRIIYAPQSDIGTITVDSEAMYINLPEDQVGFTKREGEEDDADLPEAVKLVRSLQNKDSSLDQAADSRPGLRLMRGAEHRLPKGIGAHDDDDDTGGVPRKRRVLPAELHGKEDSVALDPADGDDEDGEEEEGEGAESSGDEDDETHRLAVMQRARERFEARPKLEEAIYGSRNLGKRGRAVVGAEGQPMDDGPDDKATDHKVVPLFGDEDDVDADDDIDEPTESTSGIEKLLGNMGILDGVDTSRMPAVPGMMDALDEEASEALKARKFVTGGWSSAEEDEEGEPKGNKGMSGAVGGDAEAGKDEPTAKAGTVMEEASGGATGSSAPAVDVVKTADPNEVFNDSMPIATFVRIRIEDVPAAIVAELRRDRILLLGGLLPGEARMGLVQVRVKRHRWHPKLLKSNDPLLISAGWRRYQTVPTFSLEDRGEKRMQYLKYTLEHAHCHMTLYGPTVPPNAGIMAFRSWKGVGSFRVAATGGVLETAPNFNIVKKLKLVGEPYKIFKNTAFIKGMFTSDLEVAKYAHAKIQTVSGIRGEVKKAEGTQGCFRATFEDRILRSDIVVCKCWMPVPPKEFYHPVVDVARWRPARLIGELRATKGVPVPENSDSRYGAQYKRPERKFNPLRIPKGLEASLPYKSKPKLQGRKKVTELTKAASIVSTDQERKINALMNRLYTVRKEKHRLRKDVSTKKKVIKEKREQFIQDKRDVHTQEAKKKRYVKQGKRDEHRKKALRLD